MAVRPLFPVAAVLALAAAAIAQGATAKVKCGLAFEVAAPEQGKTTNLTLVAVLPQSVSGRQVVAPIRFSQAPAKQFTEGDVSYALWEFTPAPQRLTLRVDAEIELTAPARAKPPAGEKKIDRDRWLAAEKFIEADDPAIRAAAKRLAGKDTREVARSAAKLVIDTVQFSGFAEASAGAVAALRDRRGDCTEFSDLMVALLRARGIPARHVSGFTTEWNDTARHDWVEVHCGADGWVLFDPTFARREIEQLSGPRPTYIRMSTVRHDAQLEDSGWFRYRYTGAPATVAGTVTIDTGSGPKTCSL